MYPVGQVKRAAERLLEVTYESLMRGIAAVRPGARTGAIGEAIQTYAEAERCSVVRDFCGHGVGRLFHDSPNILHYGRANEGPELREGMIFTIEPMINLGRPHVKVLADGWTAVTRDRSLSAQYEHTVGVTADGCEDLQRFRPRSRPAGPTAAQPVTLAVMAKDPFRRFGDDELPFEASDEISPWTSGRFGQPSKAAALAEEPPCPPRKSIITAIAKAAQSLPGTWRYGACRL